eukprot:m.185333 g.185333  ORF g.185333 m.185333 type:complete len:452 (+) comp16414_c0_seq1:127-1482(+)
MPPGTDTGSGDTGGHRSTKKIDVDPSEFPMLLKQYYDRLFPYHKFYRWLSYGKPDAEYFSKREFSFTLKDDVYIRYRSYASEEEMTADIKKMNPYKIDIGAIFSGKPKDHKKIKASEFQPLEKELVFDIDMTDYDEIRPCCSGAAICKRCWPFMNCAIKVVNAALKEDFGFEHLLWVYSGRRGVHCWVCDQRARALSNDSRSAIAEYLSVVTGSDANARRVNLRHPVHPSVDRALDIARDYFSNWVVEGADKGGLDVLAYKEHQEKLLSVIGDEDCEEAVKQRWSDEDARTSMERWKALEQELEDQNKKTKGTFPPYKFRAREIMLQYTYPRLDVNVSKQLNHLLKSPFVVHPKTGRVCVPIDVDDLENFNPFDVPTIGDLMNELDEYDEAHKNDDAMESDRPVKNFEKTSMLKVLALFDRFLSGLASENRVAQHEARMETEAAAAATGDW